MAGPIKGFLQRLDDYGHIGWEPGLLEDRCGFCGAAVDLHPCWKHRVYAFIATCLGVFDG
jgi:hypothetical protein